MELSGKIIKVLTEKGGTTASGNVWKSQQFVLETHDSFPKHLCYEVFGEERLKACMAEEGDEVIVSFDIDAHEYNGKWYNSIRAYNVRQLGKNSHVLGSSQPLNNPTDTF